MYLEEQKSIEAIWMTKKTTIWRTKKTTKMNWNYWSDGCLSDFISTWNLFVLETWTLKVENLLYTYIRPLMLLSVQHYVSLNPEIIWMVWQAFLMEKLSKMIIFIVGLSNSLHLVLIVFFMFQFHSCSYRISRRNKVWYLFSEDKNELCRNKTGRLAAECCSTHERGPCLLTDALEIPHTAQWK